MVTNSNQSSRDGYLRPLPVSKATEFPASDSTLGIRKWLYLHTHPSSSSEAGLTLLECLVAIVVISVILVAITPPIFLVTATRVQNRRAEQAMQLAQAEIDRVRTLVERGGYTVVDLPADVGANIDAAPVPSGVFGQVKSTANCSYTGGVVPAASLLQVSVDNDCIPEFLVQSFRTTGVTGTGGTVPRGFQMGVRVYSDNPTLRGNLGSLQANLQQAPSLKMASGPGSQGIRPLAVLYSTLVRNDMGTSLDDYRTLCPNNGPC